MLKFMKIYEQMRILMPIQIKKFQEEALQETKVHATKRCR